MAKLTYTRVALHGDTDIEAVRERHLEAQVRGNVPKDLRTEMPPCHVKAVYFCGEDRLEISATWETAAALAAMETYTIEVGE